MSDATKLSRMLALEWAGQIGGWKIMCDTDPGGDQDGTGQNRAEVVEPKKRE